MLLSLNDPAVQSAFDEAAAPTTRTVRVGGVSHTITTPFPSPAGLARRLDLLPAARPVQPGGRPAAARVCRTTSPLAASRAARSTACASGWATSRTSARARSGSRRCSRTASRIPDASTATASRTSSSPSRDSPPHRARRTRSCARSSTMRTRTACTSSSTSCSTTPGTSSPTRDRRRRRPGGAGDPADRMARRERPGAADFPVIEDHPATDRAAGRPRLADRASAERVLPPPGQGRRGRRRLRVAQGVRHRRPEGAVFRSATR